MRVGGAATFRTLLGVRASKESGSVRPRYARNTGRNVTLLRDILPPEFFPHG